jgi:ParB-like chromosome segregation protein Spo0J
MGKPYLSPVYNVIRVPIEKIRANSYNPNKVSPPEMKLLMKSILEDGYTMPIVCYYIAEEDAYEIVDGFHRYMVLKTCPEISEREGHCLPVSVIDKPLTERIASTIRHNRARGVHIIDLMVDIVANLIEAGLSDDWIMKNIGMDADELLRLKQISGLASLFADREFSKSWKSDGAAVKPGEIVFESGEENTDGMENNFF